MYHPTTRLLTILELLQTYRSLGAAELARRLEVTPRSVRRYILMLQDMGIPIEATHGPGGGYQLRPGYKLPPLMFTDDEATAIVLGLLGSAWLEIGQSAVAVEGALAKISRVLPVSTRERLNAISSHLFLSSYEQETRPPVALLLTLSEAIQLRQRIAFAYRSGDDTATHRTVEPYGVAGWWGRWYLVGYCCLRLGFRLFRLDRMEDVRGLTETFTRDDDFDTQKFLAEQFFGTPSNPPMQIEFQAPLRTVQQKIPAAYGTLTPTEQGVLFETQYGDVRSAAHYLISLDLPFVVHQPPALCEALRRIAEQVMHGATAFHPTDDAEISADPSAQPSAESVSHPLAVE